MQLVSLDFRVNLSVRVRTPFKVGEGPGRGGEGGSALQSLGERTVAVTQLPLIRLASVSIQWISIYSAQSTLLRIRCCALNVDLRRVAERERNSRALRVLDT